MRTRRVRVRITCRSDAPAFSKAPAIISRHRRACAPASPTPNVRPSGPSGAVPETAIMLPARAAREMPIFGSYGLPLEMSLRTVPNENELLRFLPASGYGHDRRYRAPPKSNVLSHHPLQLSCKPGHFAHPKSFAMESTISDSGLPRSLRHAGLVAADLHTCDHTRSIRPACRRSTSGRLQNYPDLGSDLCSDELRR